MPFFGDPLPRPDYDEPEPCRRRWVGVAEDTVGVPVPLVVVLVQTEELAVLVSGVMAFPAGFSLSVIVLSRLDPPREPMMNGMHARLGRRQNWDEAFVFGMGFSDGTKVTSMSWPGRGLHDEERVLRNQGGGSGGRRAGQSYWCEPLPPPGPMQLVCRWTALGIGECAVEVDAGEILEAAGLAVPIWPDDVNLPEEPEA